MFMVLSSCHSHCESSPGSFDECRLSAGWPPTLRPNQPIWAVSPPKDWLLPSADTIAIYYYYSTRKLILIVLRTQSVGQNKLYRRSFLRIYLQLYNCLRRLWWYTYKYRNIFYKASDITFVRHDQKHSQLLSTWRQRLRQAWHRRL